MSKSSYVVELTHDEAVMFVMAIRSGGGRRGRLASVVHKIGSALFRADKSLDDVQFEKWQGLGQPRFKITDDAAPL